MLLENLGSYTGEMKDLGNFLNGFITVVAVLLLVEMAMFPVLAYLNRKLRKEMLQLKIPVISDEQLAGILTSMDYPKNKNSGIDENGKAFIKGKYGVYTFYEDADGLGITFKDYASVLKLKRYVSLYKVNKRFREAKIIMNCLQKNLNPNLAVDVRGDYKKMKLKVFATVLPITLFIISLAVYIIVAIDYSNGEDTIAAIKRSNPDAYEKTYAVAIGDYADDVLWDTYTGENGYDVVNVSGMFKYAYSKPTFTLQLKISKNGKTFKPYAMEICGEPISEAAMNYIVNEMFVNCENGTADCDFTTIEELEAYLSGDYYYEDEEDVDEDVDYEDDEDNDYGFSEYDQSDFDDVYETLVNDSRYGYVDCPYAEWNTYDIDDDGIEELFVYYVDDYSNYFDVYDGETPDTVKFFSYLDLNGGVLQICEDDGSLLRFYTKTGYVIVDKINYTSFGLTSDQIIAGDYGDETTAPHYYDPLFLPTQAY
jgi:hypothetical protein